MDTPNTYVAIMAGGVGSRFWPVSREDRPKQFLDLLGVGKSLLRLTFERFLDLCPASNIFVVTNAAYTDLVAEQLPELATHQILGEPSRNDTAPCVAFTALRLATLNPEATLIIAPSDHLILQPEAFLQLLRQAVAFAHRREALLTIGIRPTHPNTGYGYIQVGPPETEGIFRVERFTEKPDTITARRFVESGQYLWNAGIFIWSIPAILKAFQQLAPDIYRILAAGKDYYGTEHEAAFLEAHYPNTRKISVDIAILEKANNVFTLPADFGWSDLGTWSSIHEQSEKDELGNVLQSNTTLLYEVKNSLVRAPQGKLVVLGGLHDYIVVDEGDVLLIWPKSDEQAVKQVRADVQRYFGEKFL
jgi:mannose-1-phosphate guanylyltransferase